MSMKNFNDSIWNRTSDLPIYSTAPYPLCYRGPRNEEGREFKIFIVVRSANCSLRFHVSESVVYMKVIHCSREFSICLNVWEHATFSRSKMFFFSIYQCFTRVSFVEII